jgi:hypothetical protein
VFDEVSHIPAGLAIFATGDVWLNPQHPPLVKELAGLAASVLRPRLPLEGAAYAAGDQWLFGREVLYLAGNDPMAIVRAGRLPVVAMSLLAAMVCFVWARERHGDVAGLLALALYAASPTILAHATLVTTDVPATLGMVATFWLWWRATRGVARVEGDVPSDGALSRSGAPALVDPRTTLLPWALCGLALGVALASKFSALLLPPMMLACDVVANGRLGLRRRIVGYAITGVVAVVVVQASYLSLAAPLRYLHDTGLVYGTTLRSYLYYLAGTFAPRFPHYFLVATAVKATPTELLAMAGALVVSWLRRRRRWRDDLYLWLPALGWFAAMSWLAVDIGVRYVLPAWAMLFVLAGNLATDLRRRTALARFGPVLLAALVVAQIAEAALSFPGYLSYANRPAGGRARITRWLDDSNVDWGQSFYRLPRWLAARGIDHARVLPMGPATVPMQGAGVKLEGMLESDWGAPRPGAYVISAHQLVRGLERARHGAPTDWLRRYEPADTFDGSMFLYVFPATAAAAPTPGAGLSRP